MQMFILNSAIKGDRNYVHGTDIYNDLCSNLFKRKYDTINEFKMTFRDFQQTKPKVILSNDLSIIKKDESCSTFSFIYGNEKKFGSIVESQIPITKRTKDKEELIISESSIQLKNSAIILEKKLDCSVADLTLFMSKHLAYTLYPIRNKQIYFRTIYLKKPIFNVSYNKIKILMERFVKEFYFVVKIIIDNRYYGNFSGSINE